ncbi:hypothetical protein ACFLYM_02780 [Chloroflexota bacterium]
MARKPEKSTVRNIINNLINSEIPEIQTVAKELAEWTKQLEEHSWKLQHYASEIENLAAAEAEGSNEVSLTELVRDLEKTLSMLREKPADKVTLNSRSITVQPEDIEEEAEVEEEITEEVTEADSALSKSIDSETRDDYITKQDTDTYTTPEGFVLKKRR